VKKFDGFRDDFRISFPEGAWPRERTVMVDAGRFPLRGGSNLETPEIRSQHMKVKTNLKSGRVGMGGGGG
jgi:hypothetical protein